MRLIVGTLTAVGLALASPAVAQAQAGVNVGMQVTDAAGGLVGTVTAIKGENLLVKTAKHEALLHKSSVTVANGQRLVGMTQAPLDAEIEQNLAAANAAITAGAIVKGSAGTAVGKIESVADGNVVIALDGGKKIQVPQTALRGNADGSVTIGYTADQLQALVQGEPAAQADGQ